jgi:hypothetical protein
MMQAPIFVRLRAASGAHGSPPAQFPKVWHLCSPPPSWEKPDANSGCEHYRAARPTQLRFRSQSDGAPSMQTPFAHVRVSLQASRSPGQGRR